MVEYNLQQAAKVLGVQYHTLKVYVHHGFINRSGRGSTFTEEDLRYFREKHPSNPAARKSREEFKRHINTTYGQESFEKLLKLLNNPCNL